MVWKQINGISLLGVIWAKKRERGDCFAWKKKRLNIPHEKMKSLYYIWDVPTITGDFIRRMQQGKKKKKPSRDRDRKSIDRHYWEGVGNVFIEVWLSEDWNFFQNHLTMWVWPEKYWPEYM